MLERSLEILVRLCAEEIFGPGWKLIGQQLAIPSGRIDLLFADRATQRHVIKVKKGRAQRGACEQVLAYARDLENILDDLPIVPWVVAHEIPARVAEDARRIGVQVRSVSISRCAELMESHGFNAATLLGPRRQNGVLHGGGPKRGLRSPMDNEVAFAAMPQELAGFLRELIARPFMDLASGGMQTVIHYRGVKLGGINRQHRGGHSYIAAGVVLTPQHDRLFDRLGFRRMTKTQAGSSHEHIWWEIPWRHVWAFSVAVDHARDVVDRGLLITREA